MCYNKFITVLYMFRATSCSSSGGQIVLLHHLVTPFSVSGRPVHRTPTYREWRFQKSKVNVSPLATWQHIAPLILNLGTDGDMWSVGQSVSYTPSERSPESHWMGPRNNLYVLMKIQFVAQYEPQLLGRPNPIPGAITTHPFFLFLLWTVSICYFRNL